MLYPNFYENLKEAHGRLLKTVVLYGDEPYTVEAITNHKDDGIFRVYLAPLEYNDAVQDFIYELRNLPPDYPDIGNKWDKWLETPRGKTTGVLRKHMNSPMFNKFRPFPLGMCNAKNGTFYLERQPLRPQKEQGLISSMINETPIGNIGKGGTSNAMVRIPIASPSLLHSLLPLTNSLSHLLAQLF